MSLCLQLRGLAAVSLLAVAGLFLLSCAEQPPPPIAPSSAPTAPDAASSADAATLTTATLEGAAAPTLVITSPVNNQKISATGVGDSLTVTVVTSDVTIGPGEHGIRYFLDGAVLDTVDSPGPYTISDFPAGRHHVAAWLVDPAGNPLDQAGALDGAHVVFFLACSDAAQCDDGLSCSVDSCLGQICRFGAAPGCCDHDLECPFGWHCDSGECLQCFGDGECDDGDPCTDDVCGGDGLCTHEVLDGCCEVDLQCDDGDACTTDSCITATSTCLHVPSGDPLCCNVDADCEPPEPCARFMCYRNAKLGIQRCRFGPPVSGCCADDTDCSDQNPCTVDACIHTDPLDPRGTCTYSADPAQPDCCLVASDCDDSDPATADSCTDNVCVHTEEPGYCPLPATSAVVLHELMVAPGPVSDANGEWIELYNPSPSEAVDLDGWLLETSLGESFTIDATSVPGGPSARTLGPRSYMVLAGSNQKTQNGGFVPHGAFGAALSLPDPFETGSPVVHTVQLKSPGGVLVDEVTYDSSTWPLEDGRSLELTHPHADNADPASWRASGHNSDPLLNRQYGAKAQQTYGSPKNANFSSAQGLISPNCSPPPGAHACTEGRCDQDNTCLYALAEGCCTEASDCNDFNACTVDGCDTGGSVCEAPAQVEGCCNESTECDDSNPCNLDRCIGSACRHSPNIVPDCCADDGDCDDGDPCTVNTCAPGSNTCEPPVPVVVGPGEQCCAADADCDDGQANTDDTCNPGTQLCEFTPNAEQCTDAGDACDDGDPCTTDSCDVGAQTCQHVAIAGCCNGVGDCDDDGNPCTNTSCHSGTNTCQHIAVGGCCVDAAGCDDADPCTTDSCSGNTCHNLAIEGCCQVDGDCDDELDCTTDSCVGGTCQYAAPPGGCCTTGADQATLQAECGADPDGAGSCWAWSCTAGGACEAIENPDCCETAADCDDESLCTVDVCPADKICKHIYQAGTGCCADDGECTPGEYCGDGAQCAPKVADGGSCTGDNQCLSSLCLDGTCTQPAGPGAFCTVNAACTSGLCVDGVCCGSLCGGACEACNLPGQEGTCASCDSASMFCDGSSQCVPKVGTGSGCASSAECVSGECVSGVCCEGACGGGEYCDGSGQCQPNPTSPCKEVVCDPGVPGCAVQSLANGSACDDGDACTGSSSCLSGICFGADPVDCSPTDQCHGAGTCDPGTGLCSNPPVADGTSCDDGDLCTGSSSCQGGSCTGADPVVCTPSDSCHDAGTCNPADGQCSDPVLADGTSCALGKECLAGVCEDVTVAPPATATVPFAAGDDHTCLLRDDGSVACWGKNDAGQLGTGAFSPLATTPRDVVGLPTAAVGLAASTRHTCALLDDASMWCWGWNGSGQLGNQQTSASASPVAALGLGFVTAIGTGQLHSCAVKEDGTVACWGNNVSEQLGGSAETSSLLPVDAAGLSGAVGIDCGAEHTCVVEDTGGVSCWGDNTYGQCGQSTGSTTDVPSAVAGLAGVSAVSLGGEHSCALVGASVKCWGRNSYGQLGNGTTTSGFTPVDVQGLSDATMISTGTHFSCAVRATGQVVCWGRNSESQLGDGGTTTQKTPVAVVGVSGAESVTCGDDFACARTGTGTVHCWGNGFHGQLGDGTTNDAVAITTVVDLTDIGRCAACDDSDPCTDDRCGAAGCEYVLRPAGTPCGIDQACDAAGACQAQTPAPGTLSVGSFQGLVLRDDGTVAAWGSNDNGQLGLGDTLDPHRTWPDDVPGLTDVARVGSGRQHQCVAHDDGTASCWGRGASGQLGRGVTGESATPDAVIGLSDVVDVQGGDYFSCALRATGEVACWGFNYYGELGRGTTGSEQPTAAAVVGIDDAVQLSVGTGHACVVREGGSIWCWGQGESGRLGNGLSFDESAPVEVAPGTAGLFHAVRVAAGDEHTCAVSVDGTVGCWGDNIYGKLGDGSSYSRKTAVAVVGLSDVVGLSVAESHGCALSSAGTVSCWGRNNDGQLGDGTTTSQDEPVPVSGLTSVSEVSCGREASCARLVSGEVWCWGEGYQGHLGDGTTETRKVPTQQVGLSTYGACALCDDSDPCTEDTCHPTLGCQYADAADGTPCGVAGQCASGVCGAGPQPVQRVAAGGRHTCAVDDVGTLSCWGRNDQGQLGDGTQVDSPTPLAVSLPQTVAGVSAYRDHTCALLSDGAVYCWGDNSQGQLGDGSETDSASPVLVAGLPTAVAVTTGAHHSCALLADQTSRCWGWGFHGRLGDGSEDDSATPVSVSRLSGTVQISAGGEHTCAVDEGGFASCWGAGGSGRLGLGTTFDQLDPTRIAPGTAGAFRVSQIAAGSTHTCALAPEGTVACVGSGLYGHLGNGGSSSEDTPVAVGGLSDAVQLDVSVDHACVVGAAGTVSCWGRGTDGRVGHGSTSTASTPVDVTPAGQTALAVATGEKHTCALLAGPIIACWGDNFYGQLGTGATGSDETSPVVLGTWP